MSETTTTMFPAETGRGWKNPKKESERYRFLHASYYGDGGYADGQYLIPHQREDEETFKLRKIKARYPNDYASILNGVLTPIFKTAPSRTFDGLNAAGQAAMDLFLGDATNAYTSYNQALKDISRAARINDSVFVFVDAPKADAITGTMADLYNRSSLPYLITIKPESVTDVQMDGSGNVLKISWTYSEYIDDELELITMTYDKMGWKKTDSDDNILDQGINTLPYVPVFALYPDGNDDPTINPKPYGMAYNLASIQYRRYNLASVIDEIADNQMFSILCVPGASDNFSLGTSNALTGWGQSDVSGEPKFISPDAKQLETLQDKLMAALVQEMYRVAGMPMQTNQAQSAEAKRLENQRTQEILLDFARQIRTLDMRILRAVLDYIGFAQATATVNYQVQYGIESLDNFVSAYSSLANSSVAPPPEVLTELATQIYKILVEKEDETSAENFMAWFKQTMADMGSNTGV